MVLGHKWMPAGAPVPLAEGFGPPQCGFIGWAVVSEALPPESRSRLLPKGQELRHSAIAVKDART